MEKAPRKRSRDISKTAYGEIYGKYAADADDGDPEVLSDAVETVSRQEPQAQWEPRKRYSITCATCGISTTIPFEPQPGYPVYCQPCFMAEKYGDAALRGRSIVSGKASCEGCGEEIEVRWWMPCPGCASRGHKATVTLPFEYGKSPKAVFHGRCQATVGGDWRSPDFRKPLRCNECRHADKRGINFYKPRLYATHRQAIETMLCRVYLGYVPLRYTAKTLSAAGFTRASLSAMPLSKRARRGLDMVAATGRLDPENETETITA